MAAPGQTNLYSVISTTRSIHVLKTSSNDKFLIYDDHIREELGFPASIFDFNYGNNKNYKNIKRWQSWVF